VPRPFTRAQALENRAFLAELRRTGNARAAARALGAHRARFTRRRAKHPAFAAEWDAALAFAHAALRQQKALSPSGEGSAPISPSPSGEGLGWGLSVSRGPTPAPSPEGEGRRARRKPDPSGKGRRKRAAPGPEPRLVRLASGRLQLRRASGRRLTRAAEQTFLAALSATANIRLSAAAAGFAHSSFYARARRSPAFAREMRLALQMGYERIEMALIESFCPSSHADDAWRHNEPPPIPPMSPNQALQLLHLHHKTAKLWADRRDRRRGRGEDDEAWSRRLREKWEAEHHRALEDWWLGVVARLEGDEPSPHEPSPPILPMLDQVTGWSKADPAKPPHDESRALFGGWRIEDWEDWEG